MPATFYELINLPTEWPSKPTCSVCHTPFTLGVGFSEVDDEATEVNFYQCSSCIGTAASILTEGDKTTP